MILQYLMNQASKPVSRDEIFKYDLGNELCERRK